MDNSELYYFYIMVIAKTEYVFHIYYGNVYVYSIYSKLKVK